jgi:hypothetical protein
MLTSAVSLSSRMIASLVFGKAEGSVYHFMLRFPEI